MAESVEDVEAGYCAFLSHRFDAPDEQVARELSRMLGAYRLPADVRPERHSRRLARPFFGQEDIRHGSSIHGEITKALLASHALIVVCTERVTTGDSPWVRDEIREFVRLHGTSPRPMLPIVAAGDPELVLPDELAAFRPSRGSAGLGGAPAQRFADVRGPTARVRRRRLRAELVRIVAALIDVDVELLRQSEEARARRVRLVRTSLVVTALIAVAAAGVLLWLQWQVAERARVDAVRQALLLRAERAGLLAAVPGQSHRALAEAVAAVEDWRALGKRVPATLRASLLGCLEQGMLEASIQVLDGPGLVTPLVVSQDGRHVIAERDEFRVVRIDVERATTFQLTDRRSRDMYEPWWFSESRSGAVGRLLDGHVVERWGLTDDLAGEPFPLGIDGADRVSFDGIGKRVLVNGSRALELWDPERCERISVLGESSIGWVVQTFAQGGAYVAVARGRGPIRIVRADDGAEIGRLHDDPAIESVLAGSASGSLWVARSRPSRLHVLSSGGKQLRSWSEAELLALSDDGASILVHDFESHRPELWSTSPFRRVENFPEVRISEALFSPDGARVAVTLAEGGVQVWSSSEPRLRLLGASSGARLDNLTCDPTGHGFAATDTDGLVQLFDGNAERVAVLGADPSGVHGNRSAFRPLYSRDGTRLFTPAADGILRVWRTRPGPEPARRYALPEGLVEVLSIEPSAEGLTVEARPPLRSVWRPPDSSRFSWRTASSPPELATDPVPSPAVFDLKEGRLLVALDDGPPVTDIGLAQVAQAIASPDGRKVAVALPRDGVALVDRVHGRVEWTGEAPGRLAALSNQGDVAVQDLGYGEVPGLLTLLAGRDGASIWSGRAVWVAMAALGDAACLGLDRPEILLVDLGAKTTRTIVLAGLPVVGARFSASGELLVAVDSGGRVTLCDVADAAVLWSVAGAPPPADGVFDRCVSCIDESAPELLVPREGEIVALSISLEAALERAHQVLARQAASTLAGFGQRQSTPADGVTTLARDPRLPIVAWAWASLAVLSAAAASEIARQRRRNVILWAALGGILPILGAVAGACFRARPRSKP